MQFGIIAAGEGSRLLQEGLEKPKPLIEIDGEPMIERLIRIFMKSGARSVYIVVNDRMPEVKDYLNELKDRLPIELEIKIKSTPSSMHTFHELTRLFPENDKFVVTTVDTIFREEKFHNYVAAFESMAPEEGGLMGVTDYIEDEKPLYVETDDELNLLGFSDSPRSGCNYISGGIYGLDGRAVGILEECIGRGMERMRNFQRELISSGLPLKAYPMGKIIDVDHIDDIKRAEEMTGAAN